MGVRSLGPNISFFPREQMPPLTLLGIIHQIFSWGYFFSKLWYFGALESVPGRSLVLCRLKVAVCVCSKRAPCHQTPPLARGQGTHAAMSCSCSSTCRLIFVVVFPKFLLDPGPRTVSFSEVIPGSWGQ